MDDIQIILNIVSIGIIILILLLFIKYFIYGDVVERNLDKIVAFFTKKKKVK